MAEPQAEEPLDLREYLAILRVRKWTIVVVTLLVLGVALAYSFQQTPIYRAQTKVLVKPIPTGPEDTATEPNLETQSELVSSELVAEMVAHDLAVNRTLGSLLSNLRVIPVGNTEVLAITYTSDDPEFAAAAADSFAENYIEFRIETANETLRSAEDQVQSELETTLSQLEEINSRLRAAAASGDAVLVEALETQRTALAARLGVLQQRQSEVRPDRSLELGGGEIIEPAGVPSSAVSPNHLTNGLVGLILGVLLGVAAAFVRDRLADRFRGRADIERVVDAPVLATVPRFKTSASGLVRGRRERTPPTPVVTTEPHGAASEAYRTLRINLQFVASQRGINSVLVTSPVAAEGKTVTTVNLGVALAQAGQKVILVSADLRRPTLEDHFGIDRRKNGLGLSTWLTGEEDDLLRLIVDPGVPNLRVLPSGRIPHNPAELLASPRLPELVSWLKDSADLVLFDSTPTLALADAVTLASRVDGAILVIDAARTHRSATLHAKQELERAGTHIVGSVLNAFDPSSSPYFSPYYHYRYAADQAEGDGHAEREAGVQTPRFRRARRLFRSRR